MQAQLPTASSWPDSIFVLPGALEQPFPSAFVESNAPNQASRPGQFDNSFTQVLSDFQPAAELLSPQGKTQQPTLPSLHKLSSNDSNGSHYSQSTSPAGTAEPKSSSQPASLPGQVAQQDTKAKAAGGRAKRQRPPAVNKLREADEQIAVLTKQLRAVELQKESLQLRNRLLERDLQTTSWIAPWSDLVSQMVDDNTRRLVEAEMGHKCDMGLRLPGSSSALTRQQVMSMSHLDFLELERRYADAFAEVLLECSPEDTSSPAAKRLEALVADEFRLHCCFALSRTTLEEFRSLTANPAVNAPELLKAIGLSPRQSAALRMLRRVYARNLGPLLAERKRVYTALQALGPPVGGCGAHPPEAVALVERTRELLKEEHSHLVAFNLGLWRKVMTPFQHASLQLQVYPAIHCESFDMVERLAKDAGEPDFAVLLHEAASLPAAVVIPMDSAIMAIPAFLADDDPRCSNDMSDVLQNMWLLLGFMPR